MLIMAEHPPHIDNFPALVKRRERIFFANVLAIIGLIAVVVIGVLGISHIGTLSAPWFSSFFGRSTSSKTTLQITAPRDVTAGKPFTLSWKHTATDKGMYALMYPCNAGIGLDSQFASTSRAIPCGAAFTLGTATTQATFVPHLFATSTVSVPVTVLFIPSATTSAQMEGTAKIAFHAAGSGITTATTTRTTTAQTTPAPKQAPETSTPSTNKPAPVTTPVQTAPSGHPDLVVRIVAIGVIDPATNSLIPRAPVSPQETAAVQFDVVNAGTAATGPWRFSAHLPTRDGYAYYSPVQTSLAAGGHIMNTLQFTQTAPGLSVFSVMVNPDGMVRESNTNNNAATINISAQY